MQEIIRLSPVTTQSESPFIILTTKSREINSASSKKELTAMPKVSFSLFVDIALFS